MEELVVSRIRSNIRWVVKRVIDANDGEFNEIVFNICLRLIDRYVDEIRSLDNGEIFYRYGDGIPIEQYSVSKVRKSVDSSIKELWAIMVSSVYKDVSSFSELLDRIK